jgi:hypothetical protein
VLGAQASDKTKGLSPESKTFGPAPTPKKHE